MIFYSGAKIVRLCESCKYEGCICVAGLYYIPCVLDVGLVGEWIRAVLGDSHRIDYLGELFLRVRVDGSVGTDTGAFGDVGDIGGCVVLTGGCPS